MIEREDQYRFELDWHELGMFARCTTCSTEIPIPDEESLAEVIDRASEHAEVCK